MRTLLVMLVIAGCGKGTSSATPGSNVMGSSSVAAPAGSSLKLNGVTLLENEGVIAQRLSDVDAMTALLKGVAQAVGRYDAAHPGSLPAQVDAVVVARASGSHVWLVGPEGDVAANGLDADIAKLAPLPVKDRHVAAIVHLLREGTSSTQELGKLPASWAAAAGSDGSDIDTVVDRVWPR